MGGLLSDRNSFIGPYALNCCVALGYEKQATETLGPIRLASTLCCTLLNLSFVISYKKREPDCDARYTNKKKEKEKGSSQAEYLPSLLFLYILL